MNTYLTYADYTERGGRLDEAAFSRWIGRATMRVENDTHGRLAGLDPVPDEVKGCLVDIVEILAAYESDDREATSRSQTVGGISESVTYADAGESGKEDRIEAAENDWLLGLVVNGIPVLYRGAR